VNPASVRSCRNSLRKIIVARTLFRELNFIHRRSINLVSYLPLAHTVLSYESDRFAGQPIRAICNCILFQNRRNKIKIGIALVPISFTIEIGQVQRSREAYAIIYPNPPAAVCRINFPISRHREERMLPAIYRPPRELNPTFLRHPVAPPRIGRCPPMHPVVYPVRRCSIRVCHNIGCISRLCLD